MVSIDWGDAPTWVAGAFAAAAAYYARSTLKSQQKQISEQQEFIAEQAENLHLERRALIAAAEDRRWEQVRQVHFTAVVTKGEGGLGPGGRPLVNTAVWVAMVTNSSQGPINSVQVAFGEDQPTEVLQEKPSYEVVVEEASTIPAGGVWVFDSPRGTNEYLNDRQPMVTFVDVHGNAWQLDRFQKISEVDRQ
ncbi:hypothetical protein J7E87_19990 [Streptomyces sp. ISL-1]|uniref:hypothetical protein n=1 Tax=Streptomyces sp. ISL-1 TaxID=2817657 RepID=UPI001BEB030A|nr:hypothetical protein [Streptomyces sp. ISL-1]MBT2391652.1 hypothetical protein [Streptomyces sp. ISL-1]